MKVKYIDCNTTKVEEKAVNPIETFAQDNNIPFNVID
jgi:hypothetical protein